MNLEKSLYGLLHSEFMFDLKLATDLKNNGFIINTHDTCVKTTLVKGEARAVVWHVDDLKVS